MNTDNRIGLISVADLKGFRFVIPDYQRGYRWEKQQVTDLLKDLKFFMDGGNSGYYCLQPLAVKKCLTDLEQLRDKVSAAFEGDDQLVVDSISQALNNSVSWEVIDGQQRLTTIYLLIRLLDPKADEPYSINYQTREKSAEFLKGIGSVSEEKANGNIDFLHMFNAFNAAKEWLSKNAEQERASLMDIISNRVKFIWYESVNERPLEVFTRLNIGKISLTNAELIKATLLNRSNYPEETGDSFRHLQIEIASKWDRIEYTLQNDEFWLFLNQPSYVKPTRIDFLFETIYSWDMFELKKSMREEAFIETIGKDRYSVFRYFATAVTNRNKEKSMSKHIQDIWNEIDKLFGTFVEWYEDKYYYHYIGYLIWDCEERGDDKFSLLKKLYAIWKENDKNSFTSSVIKKIKESLIRRNSPELTVDNLNELDYLEDKDIIKRVLLLHNILEVIDNQEVQSDKYDLEVFYRFPFHIFKKEVWNVEHIDSATTNELTSPSLQKAWARAARFALDKYGNSAKTVKEELEAFLGQADKDVKNLAKGQFENLFNKVDSLFLSAEDRLNTPDEGQADQDNERNHPWNLTLLDEGTNKSYGNYIFSVKRSFIIYKEKGRHCHLDDKGTVVDDGKAIAFVPPCTKQVFMKYYNPDPTNLLIWGRCDAQAYLEDIKQKLRFILA